MNWEPTRDHPQSSYLREFIEANGMDDFSEKMDYRYSSRIPKFSLKPGLYKIVLGSYFERDENKSYAYDYYLPVIYRCKEDNYRRDFDYFALYDVERDQYRLLPAAVFSEMFKDLWPTQADKVIEKTQGELSSYLKEMDYRYLHIGSVPVRTLVSAFMPEIDLYPMVFVR